MVYRFIIPAVFLYSISSILRYIDTAVSKPNPQFKPVPLYTAPATGTVWQVTGMVWYKVTHGVTCVTPYLAGASGIGNIFSDLFDWLLGFFRRQGCGCKMAFKTFLKSLVWAWGLILVGISSVTLTYLLVLVTSAITRPLGRPDVYSI